jgi:hypothetical protein
MVGFGIVLASYAISYVFFSGWNIVTVTSCFYPCINLKEI